MMDARERNRETRFLQETWFFIGGSRIASW
jgi:hypothetical protein